jgi:hypothetical protein
MGFTCNIAHQSVLVARRDLRRAIIDCMAGKFVYLTNVKVLTKSPLNR